MVASSTVDGSVFHRCDIKSTDKVIKITDSALMQSSVCSLIVNHVIFALNINEAVIKNQITVSFDSYHVLNF